MSPTGGARTRAHVLSSGAEGRFPAVDFERPVLIAPASPRRRKTWRERVGLSRLGLLKCSNKRLAQENVTTSSTAEELRAAGLRVTPPRHAVLDWLDDNPHATAEQIFTGIRERLGSVSMQATYDVLAVCVETGLVRRIELAGHAARFERRTGDNHHHVMCRSCGRVEDVDCAVDTRPCLTPSNTHGFDISMAEVVYWGICPDCRAAAVAAGQTDDRSEHADDSQENDDE